MLYFITAIDNTLHAYNLLYIRSIPFLETSVINNHRRMQQKCSQSTIKDPFIHNAIN